MSTCPIHGEECGRSARFAELDALIASGWGNAPARLIEMVRRKNGGILPDTVPSVYAEEEIAKKHERLANASAGNLNARGKAGVLTPEQIDAIPELLQTMNVSAIARQYGVARNTIRWHVSQVRRNARCTVKLVIRTIKAVPKDEIDSILRLHAQGVGAADIARRMEMSYSSVRGIIWRNSKLSAA